jgi:hypothetical protein
MLSISSWKLSTCYMTIPLIKKNSRKCNRFIVIESRSGADMGQGGAWGMGDRLAGARGKV